jgi:glutathione S-transferase
MIDLYELAGANPAHRFSPYCWRIRMALAHKGLNYRSIPWRFTDRQALPGSPANKRVPVIVDGGFVVGESTAIAYHLESAYPNAPSLFGGSGGEAHARFIIAWADLTLIPALFPILAPDILPHLSPKDQAYFRESRERRLGCTLEESRERRSILLPAFQATLPPLRYVLANQPFLGGDEPSYADYAVFGAFQWARCVSAVVLVPAGEVIANWLGEMLDLFGGDARAALVKTN